MLLPADWIGWRGVTSNEEVCLSDVNLVSKFERSWDEAARYVARRDARL